MDNRTADAIQATPQLGCDAVVIIFDPPHHGDPDLSFWVVWRCSFSFLDDLNELDWVLSWVGDDAEKLSPLQQF